MINLGEYKVHREKQKNGRWKATVTSTIEIPNKFAEKIFKKRGDDVPRSIEEALMFVFLKEHYLGKIEDE